MTVTRLARNTHLWHPSESHDLGKVLGEEGWAKVLKLDEYAPRRPQRPDKLQRVLFSYTEAV